MIEQIYDRDLKRTIAREIKAEPGPESKTGRRRIARIMEVTENEGPDYELQSGPKRSCR